MGASEWLYFTPHDPNPERALQTLREQVFREGTYRSFGQLPPGLAQSPKAVLLRLRLIAGVARAFLAVASALRWLARGGQGPKTIEEALEEAAEDGTHSILDITHIASQQEFAAAVRLSEARLVSVFGTTQPTRLQVEGRKDIILRDLERWEAVYFPVYGEGQIKERAFLGCSGD